MSPYTYVREGVIKLKEKEITKGLIAKVMISQEWA